MRLILPITIAFADGCRRSGRVIAIGTVPSGPKAFFRGLSGHLAAGAWEHFRGLVLALAVSHGSTID